MNKKIIAPAVAGAAIILVAVILFSQGNQGSAAEISSVSYTQTNQDLKSVLEQQNISMSSALKLEGDSLKQYCTFFSNATIQDSLEYCTSTELKDSQGNYLGNIHMVGKKSEPLYVIGVIQADPTISQLDDIKTIFNDMVESVVCKCWQQEKPGGFESVSDWIDAGKDYQLQAKKITGRSEIKGLAQKDLLLEITTNTEGYLWKFIIQV